MNKQWTRHSLLLLVGMATASSVFAQEGLFRGVYTSLSIGGLETAAKMEHASAASFFYPLLGPMSLGNSQANRDWNTSGVGALTLGYGDFISNNFHLAGEIFVNVSKRHTEISSDAVWGSGTIAATDYAALNTDSRSELRNWEYGIDLKPGYLYNPCSMIYARVGVAFNRHELDSASRLSIVEPATPFSADSFTSSSDDKSRAALRLGLGIEHAMTPNLSVIADYIYTYYGSLDTGSVADAFGTTVTAGGFSSTASSKLYTQAGMIGLKYYFF